MDDILNEMEKAGIIKVGANSVSMAGFEIKVYERGLEVAKRQRNGGKS